MVGIVRWWWTCVDFASGSGWRGTDFNTHFTKQIFVVFQTSKDSLICGSGVSAAGRCWYAEDALDLCAKTRRTWIVLIAFDLALETTDTGISLGQLSRWAAGLVLHVGFTASSVLGL